MAEHLARIIGTEEDRVNCPFYWKIGACRHGDQCSRTHYKPTSGQTLILRHLYQNPPVALAIAEGQDVDDEVADQAQDQFEAFFEEVFAELSKFGEIEETVVVDNIGDHMIGNTYVKYCNEEDAEVALRKLTGRYYGGRLIEAEFSPVTDFREARCRQFVDGQCTRGGYCNFMHLKHIPRSLRRKLMKRMYDDHPEYSVNRAKELEGNKDKSRDQPRDSGRGGDRWRDYDRNRRRPREWERRRSDDGRREDVDEPPRNRPERSSSAERRAMIAQWNEENEVV
eukprot:Protomagalhaensia_sp_Gyna_25__2474@NODE_2384_length_1113_cov_202_348231_g1978_i0_p1_GENE_NODE_2384_length_1113_cov_202_348231_g1978_i0NODE_2384_length_1113_cov_202_348231_g1978_i0_p1_ORF_typecomplete_len298_score29_54zfCCCH/PF00642_24/2e06zfCCCH/PF00642_24/0_024RRM_1/PF00076_22/4_6e06RRM_1/PF00076_22/1_2e03zfCCCH_3/PF15663_5/0_23zfCCCH_3/PF15663_5/0_011Torus/PF16131_5/0_095Torus/PF16131_5/0_017Torus/PF16131_5/5_6e03zf_CCCH_4/PF18345_1/0_17zf_CCCH_4/PF18345_1/0_15Nup35_RRM/PF05172_13/0_041Nup35_R